MSVEAMRRLPEKKIWQTVDGMVADLHVAHEALSAAHAHMTVEDREWHKNDFIVALTKIRCLSEEILRWELL